MYRSLNETTTSLQMIILNCFFLNKYFWYYHWSLFIRVCLSSIGLIHISTWKSFNTFDDCYTVMHFQASYFLWQKLSLTWKSLICNDSWNWNLLALILSVQMRHSVIQNFHQYNVSWHHVLMTFRILIDASGSVRLGQKSQQGTGALGIELQYDAEN